MSRVHSTWPVPQAASDDAAAAKVEYGGPSLGIPIGSLLPTRLLPAEAAVPLGLGVVAVSVLLVIAAVHELRRKKMAFDVRKRTSTIVRTGVFCLTRNPVYLSMRFSGSRG